MTTLLEIIFWLSVLLVLHSYIFFPWLLQLLASGRKQNSLVFTSEEELPEVAILLAVHNEEKVIEEKIRSTFRTTYPLHKIRFYIGSDCSTDATNPIIERFSEIYPQIRLTRFTSRTGKIRIINSLSGQATAPVLVLTDANVFFEEDTLWHLVKHFRNPEVGLVGGNILNLQYKKEGISFQERAYLLRENKIKYQEGVLWGTMIGAFGGCFAIRRSCFRPTPENFIVDDFYVSMEVLQQKKQAINELEAVCFEDVSNKISEEFRRKVRISTGNFQNLQTFRKLLWPPFTGAAFSFFSHKVLRWCTPFLLLIIFFTNLLLLNEHLLYRLSFLMQVLLLSLILFDFLLKKLHIHIKLFRFITHFYSMNLALLLGWFRYVRGVQNSIWTPTQRQQS